MISRFPRFFSVFSFFLNNFLGVFFKWVSRETRSFCKHSSFLDFSGTHCSLILSKCFFFFFCFSFCGIFWKFCGVFFLLCVGFFSPPVYIEFCTEIQVLEQGWWNGSFLSKGKYSSHRGRSNLIQAPISFRGELQQGCYVLSALCKALTGCRRVDSTASGGHNGWCWNLWKKRTDLCLEVPGIGGDQLLIFPHKSSSWSWIKIDTVSSSSQLEVRILHALSILWVSPNCCSKHQAIG